ncbi:MAG TPA: TetR/AcrR family transcriptional regulator [Bryobacteraceae bacterium]|nr:TetR/AcrR family transcriptional regulator [Bryobacteraceae bacterium]
MYTDETQTTSELIADAALAILESEGSSAVTMRRVAQAVGITPMAIYYHFPNREALLNTITDREFEKLIGYIQSVPQTGSAENRFINTALAYADYALDRARVFEYVFSAARPGARRFPEDFRARRSPSLNLIADAIANAMASGFLKRDDVWEVAFTTTAHTHGYVTLYLGGRISLDRNEFRALVRRSLRRLLHGLKA